MTIMRAIAADKMMCLLDALVARLISNGDQFTRWTVLRKQNSGHRPAFICKCSCGTERLVLRQSLISGASKSCGCLQSELSRQRFVTHGAQIGGKKSPEYSCWDSMLQRVRHQDQPRNKNYRGCSVDARWDPQQGGSFENFFRTWGNALGLVTP